MHTLTDCKRAKQMPVNSLQDMHSLVGPEAGQTSFTTALGWNVECDHGETSTQLPSGGDRWRNSVLQSGSFQASQLQQLHLSPVGLPHRAFGADPVCPLVAAAGQLAGIEACFCIGIPVPHLYHLMLAVSQEWSPRFCCDSALGVEALWAA